MPLDLQRLGCLLGLHVYDIGSHDAWKRRVARMGVDVRRGLPCACIHCGKAIYR